MNKILQITIFVLLIASIVSGALFYVITTYNLLTPMINDVSYDTTQSYQTDTEEVYL